MYISNNITPPLCLTIGNFDGVHLGHQFLINQTKQIAEENKLVFGIMTFWPHPRTVLMGTESHKPLTTREVKHNLLKLTTPAKIIELPFTKEFANLSPSKFMLNYLIPLNVKRLVTGHDFTLGHNREGTEEILLKLGNQFNIDITRTPAFTIEGKPVSSTRLRAAIENGKVDEAKTMLGRYYQITGKIDHGRTRGREMGFPTANLENIEVLLPKEGVYATFAIHNGKKFPSVTNIGTNPTFNNQKLSVETFILDTHLNLYGETLSLEFVKYLRPEKKFSTPQELAAQISKDITQAREIFANLTY